MMKAVILAAGKGTRMYPLTNNTPKMMLPVANKPILHYVIVSAHEAGISKFIIVVGHQHHAEKITECFGDGSGMGVNIEYVHQGKDNGTACAINAVRDYVSGRFLVLSGDTIVPSSHIKKLIQHNADNVISAVHVKDPSEFGVINVDLCSGKVLSIIEKPQNPSTNFVNAGVYLFSQNIFGAICETVISERGEYEITAPIQLLIDSGVDVQYLEMPGGLISISRPWDLLDANEYMLSHTKLRIKGEVEPLATLKGHISVGKGTLIRSGSYIEGNVIIGTDCDIGPNCYIRSGTSIGDNVRIGSAVEIKNSIIMNGTHIRHLSYVGDSIIGENCNLGAGTTVANLRHDGKTIRVKINGIIVDSGKRKLGVIIGDNVHTGINTAINAGTIIKSNTNTMPGEIIKLITHT